jgi:hypothetical protein
VVYASIALKSLPALRWRCLPHRAGIFVGHCSCCGVVVVPSLVVINCISQRPRLWWSPLALRWRCLPHGAGIFSVIAMMSSPLSRWRLPACNLVVACSIAVVLVSLPYAALLLYTPLATLSSHAALLSCWLCFCAQCRLRTRHCLWHLQRSTQICHAPCHHCRRPWLRQCLTSKRHTRSLWRLPFRHPCRMRHVCYSGVIDAQHCPVSHFCIASHNCDLGQMANLRLVDKQGNLSS